MENSPLARLPSEIRNLIYEDVLRRNRCDITLDDEGGAHLECAEQALAITQTCKVIRRETRSTFFAINRFDFHEPRADLLATRFLYAMTCLGPENVQAVRQVKITTDLFLPCTCDIDDEDFCNGCDRVIRSLQQVRAWKITQASLELQIETLTFEGHYEAFNLDFICELEEVKVTNPIGMLCFFYDMLRKLETL